MRAASQVYGTLSPWAQEGLLDLLCFAVDRCDQIKEVKSAQGEYHSLSEVVETLLKLGVPRVPGLGQDRFDRARVH
jgi:hypothetical protein